MARRAACCCGSTSIEVDGDPVIHAVCHCDNCKRRTGSAFGISAYFEAAQVLGTTGDPQSYVIEGDNHQERFFRKTCGTTLFWKADRFAGLTGVAGGCFTESPLPEPTLTVSNRRRYSWLSLPDRWSTSLD